MPALPTLRFDNAFVRHLPGDPSDLPGTRQVAGALWSRVEPTPVAAPRLLAHSPGVAARLGFETTVALDAIRAVDVQPGDGARALEEMAAAGVQLIDDPEARRGSTVEAR